jgi:hypothetical protein
VLNFFVRRPDIGLASYSIIPLQDRLSTLITKLSVFLKLKLSFKGNVHTSRILLKEISIDSFFIVYVVPCRYFPKLYIASISSNLGRINTTHSLATEGFHRVEQSPFSLSMTLMHTVS